ncbi:MAG TPA: shikimate dehydrogenase [Actinomycetota bacterium]|nr:shikimate dehydrogenase [Actinomycetota bacterium]
MSTIGGTTQIAGVIGWPVEHSLSPTIHNAAFAALGMDWVYVPLPVAPGTLAAAVKGVAALGFRGVNVTMPHKSESAELADELSDEARRLRAVNAFVVRGGRLHGHNTDAPGFERFVREDAGFDPAGCSAIVLGAGGAARAVALALAHAGASDLRVAVREAARANDLVSAIEGTDLRVDVVPLDDASGMRADLVVNATPLGADGVTAPPLPAVDADVVVVDLLYRPAVTPWQLAAREAGAEVFGGLGLLLQQAALSFDLWTGTPAPLEVMSAAALASMAERH